MQHSYQTVHADMTTCPVTQCRYWDELQSTDISVQWMVTEEDLVLYSNSECKSNNSHW